jgi:uncharacterized protein (TIGR00369 family)
MSTEHHADTAEPSWGEERTREISWHDPRVGALRAPELSGRDYLNAMLEGRLPGPPIAQTLGFTLTQVGDGEVWFGCEPHESHYNPIGLVHGGLVCTLLDSALGCAVHTQLPAGTGYASIEIKVSYLRALSLQSGPLVAHGWVTKPGRRVAFADADVRDATGQVVATASGSCLIMGG